MGCSCSYKAQKCEHSKPPLRPRISYELDHFRHPKLFLFFCNYGLVSPMSFGEHPIIHTSLSNGYQYRLNTFVESCQKLRSTNLEARDSKFNGSFDCCLQDHSAVDSQAFSIENCFRAIIQSTEPCSNPGLQIATELGREIIVLALFASLSKNRVLEGLRQATYSLSNSAQFCIKLVNNKCFPRLQLVKTVTTHLIIVFSPFSMSTFDSAHKSPRIVALFPFIFTERLACQHPLSTSILHYTQANKEKTTTPDSPSSSYILDLTILIILSALPSQNLQAPLPTSTKSASTACTSTSDPISMGTPSIILREAKSMAISSSLHL